MPPMAAATGRSSARRNRPCARAPCGIRPWRCRTTVRRRASWTTTRSTSRASARLWSSSGWCGFGESPTDRIRVAVAMPVAEIDAVNGAVRSGCSLLALALLAAGLIAGFRPPGRHRPDPAGAPRPSAGPRSFRRLEPAGRRVPDRGAAVGRRAQRVLGQQERLVERARAQAGDLAHGLEDLAAAPARGGRSPARRPRIEVDRIRGTGAAHAGRDRAPARPRPSTDRRAGSAARGHRWRPASMHWYASSGRSPPSAASSLAIAVDADLLGSPANAADLEEMLGNLLDNACKWGGRASGSLPALEADASLRITVEDDGPGLDDGRNTRPRSRAAHASTSACPAAGWVSPSPATSPRSTVDGRAWALRLGRAGGHAPAAGGLRSISFPPRSVTDCHTFG